MFTKQAVLALLFAGANAKITYVDTKKISLIIKGVLDGAVQAEGLDNIETCIKDTVNIVKDAETAIGDFEKKDAKNVLAGLKEVAKIIVESKSAIADCKNVKGDLEMIEKMAKALSSPESFAYHVGKDLIVNRKNIFNEIDTAVTDYKNSDWEGFGFNVGEAAAKTILGSEKVTSEAGQKFSQVLKGVIKAFGGKFDIKALIECIGDESKAFKALEQAFLDFEDAYATKNYKEAISGVILTVTGIMQAKKGLAACESIEKVSWNFSGFERSEQLMSNPTKYFQVIGKDVLINGHSIFKDIGSAVSAWKSADLEKFGEFTGDIMKLASNVKTVDTEDELFMY